MPRASVVLPGAAYVALAVADSVAAAQRTTASRRLRHVLKPALMPTLATAFLRATRDGGGHARTDLLRTGTVTAQLLSWGGDVALLGTSERSFLTGVGSFFGAHVAYLAAFASVRGGRADRDTTALAATLGLWAVATPLMSTAAARQDPALRAPVAAYATIVSAMNACTHQLDPALPLRARRALRAGAALFLLSDSVLASQKFLLAEPRPLLELVVMSTYTAGQGLIAAGAAQAR